MSITETPTETTSDAENSQLTTESEAPDLLTLVCPRDGTNLEDAPRPEPGHFECPRCHQIWPAWRVVE
jgi:hypothetical protein